MRKNLLPVLIVIFVFWSFYPSVYELKQRSKLQTIRYFELVHNFYTDYNFYLSRIRQGIEGRTTVLEKYTSEPHAGSFVQVFYLALGWAGGWSRVPWHRSGDVYHVSRLVLGTLLLAMIAKYGKESFPKSWVQIAAFLLMVTASTWPKLVDINGSWRFGGYMSWWSIMDSLQRITFIPHILAGQAAIIFLAISLTSEQVLRKPGNWVFLGIVGFSLGIVFPPGLVFTYTILVIAIGLEYFFSVGSLQGSRLKLFIKNRVLPRLIFILISITALVYLQLMLSFYPWKRLAEFDISRPLPFAYPEYFMAVGPILVTGLVGLLLAIIKREKKLISAEAWVISWLALLGLFNFIPQQSPLRFSEMIPHVPLGILNAYLFSEMFNWFKQKLNHIRQRNSIYYSWLLGQVIVLVLPILMILLGLGIMNSQVAWLNEGVDSKIRAALPLVPTGSYIMYPLKDFITAIIYIQDHSRREEVILSETTAGNYIPVYSGNTVYVGHANTVEAEEKEKIVKEFFSGTMPIQTTRQWFREQKFRYVFFGPQEREDLPAGRQAGQLNDLSKVYPFLSPVYSNEFVTVYTPLE